MSEENVPESKGLDVEPDNSPQEREELGHLRYFGSRLLELERRGLITPAARAELESENRAKLEAILLHGRCRARLRPAKALAVRDPDAAIAIAEEVRNLDPSWPESWEFIINILWDAGRDEAAVAHCTEAETSFPQFAIWAEGLRRDLPIRAERRRLEAERAQRDSFLTDRIARAKTSLEAGRDGDVIDLCREVIDLEPDHIDGLAFMAFALQRSGRHEEALGHYHHLRRLQPTNSAWSGWDRELTRLVKTRSAAETGGATKTLPIPKPAEPMPRLSWASVSGEFLQEHWQKLILCMALLLIVVSSTIGAHVLLGPRLWSPIGKCALALVMTSLFAAMGFSLIRWGAARAGEMMLVTTLIVVPIHFMLAGELGLLSDISAANFAVAIVDLLAIVGLTRVVAGQLVPSREAWFLTSALSLISAPNAIAVNDLASRLWPIGAFETPAILFLLAIGSLGRQARGKPSEGASSFVPLTLGLLSFAMLATVLRIGGYELRLEPPYFAVPVMLAAGACILLAGQLREAKEKAAGSYLSWLKQIGFALSALGFALALARPSGLPHAFDGNTLAVASMGLAIYAASLSAERHPSYLYLSLAAFALCAVAFLDVVIGPDRPLEVYFGRLLGYPGKPPFPFRSIQMIGLNAVLAALSVWFARRWDDSRLAWHCHAIGLPLSIAACALSSLEPKAAAICLSIYAPLYLVAARMFEIPGLIYLGIAALAGAIHFLDLLFNPSAGFGSNAIAGTALGFACWGVATQVRRRGEPDTQAFQRPWLHGSLVLGLTALALAVLNLGGHDAIRLPSAAMFASIAALLVLLTREFSTSILAHLALGSALVAWLATVEVIRGPGDARASITGISILAFDLLLLGIAVFLRARGLLSSMSRAIPRFAIGTVLLVEAARLTTLGEHWSECLVFALGAVALFWATTVVRRQWLVYAGLACVAATIGDLVWWIAPHGNGVLLAGWEAVAASLAGFAFWGSATLGRRGRWSTFYRMPLIHGAFVLTALAFGLAIEARVLSQDAYILSVVGLILDCMVILLIGRAWRSAGMTYYAIAAFVAATYVLLLSIGEPDPRNAHVLGLIAVILALLFWGKGYVCRRLGDDCDRLYGEPLFVSSQILTVLALPMAYWSPLTMALAALSFLLMVKSFPRAEWIYPAVAALAVSAYYGQFIGHSWTSWLVGMVGAAFGLWIFALIASKAKSPLCRWLGIPELGYEFALANSAVVLALLAIGVRIAWSAGTGLPATAHAEFPLALAALAFLLKLPYRSPVFIHAGYGLLTWFFVSAPDPLWPSPIDIAASTSILAFLLICLAHLAQLPWLQNSLPRPDWLDSETLIACGWSLCLWVFSSLLSATIIISCVALAILPELWVPALKIEPAVWGRLLSTFAANIGAYHFLAAAQADDALYIGSIRVTRARVVALQALAMVWWVTAGPSFTDGGLLPGPGYLPLSTALYAAGLLAAVRYGNSRGSIVDPFLEQTICLTAILAAFFTRGTVGTNSMTTLAVSSLSLGGLGLTSRSREIGRATSYAAGLVWMAALAMAGLEVARRSGWDAGEQRAIAAAVGLMAAAYTLLPLTALVRRFQARIDDDPASSVGTTWTIASEQISFLGSLASAGCVAFAAASPASAGSTGVVVGVVILVAVAWLLIVLARRWMAESLVYLAQAALLAAYVVYRQRFPAPVANDAILLTLIAYLDFGIAEVMDRLRSPLYARPTRFVSFLLPLVPMLGARRLDEIGMFHMLAAGTFYGIAFSATRWRILGYAAAIAYNAALWVWWSRLGWTMADHPQFYFIPVGLSAILFAEANRQDLGGRAVNGFRSVGLILIYLTSAFPILNAQSFGAWLSLLVLSLVGIFAGIGLRAKVFLWFGLATFLLDIVYQLFRFSADYAVAKWAIMAGLGLGLFLFVGFNEKLRIVATMKQYYDKTQSWE